MNLPNENRTYINHDDMKSTITKFGGTWTYGNQYEIEDLMGVKRKMHIISYGPTSLILMEQLLFIYKPVQLEF